jgi:hypothetical protein
LKYACDLATFGEVYLFLYHTYGVLFEGVELSSFFSVFFYDEILISHISRNNSYKPSGKGILGRALTVS